MELWLVFVLLNYFLGLGIVHLFVGIVTTLAALHLFGPSNVSVALTFIFNMVLYLCVMIVPIFRHTYSLAIIT